MAKKTGNTITTLIQQMNSSSQEEAVEREDKFPGGRLTNLEVPDRKPLPITVHGPGRRPILIDLVIHSQDLYKQFIGFIQAGAYYHVAAESIGISTESLRQWLKTGQDDLGKAKDTFYSRLVADVRRAVAIARCNREVSIAETSPDRWLSRGPGRIFGDDWKETPRPGRNSDTTEYDELDSVGEVITPRLEDKRQKEVPPSEQGLTVLSLDPTKELETLKALQISGQLSETQLDRITQLEKQISEQE